MIVYTFTDRIVTILRDHTLVVIFIKQLNVFIVAGLTVIQQNINTLSYESMVKNWLFLQMTFTHKGNVTSGVVN